MESLKIKAISYLISYTPTLPISSHQKANFCIFLYIFKMKCLLFTASFPIEPFIFLLLNHPPIPLLIESTHSEVIRLEITFGTQQGNRFYLSEKICSFRKRIGINKTLSEALSHVTIIILIIMISDGV